MTMKFRVLGAPHIERGRQVGINDRGQPVYAEVAYAKGEVVETDIDLAKRFNPKGSPAMAKFQRLADSSRPTVKEFSRFNKAAEVEETRAEDDESFEDAPTNDEDLEGTDEDELDEGEEGFEESDEDDEIDGSVEGVGDDTLSSMTKAELIKHAEANDIDLTGTNNKTEIIARIRKAL